MVARSELGRMSTRDSDTDTNIGVAKLGHVFR